MNKNVLFFDAITDFYIGTGTLNNRSVEQAVREKRYTVEISPINGYGEDYDGNAVKSYVFGKTAIVLPKKFKSIEAYFGI